jgi:hypothetical protein
MSARYFLADVISPSGELYSTVHQGLPTESDPPLPVDVIFEHFARVYVRRGERLMKLREITRKEAGLPD